jgi:hypothetical protein
MRINLCASETAPDAARIEDVLLMTASDYRLLVGSEVFRFSGMACGTESRIYTSSELNAQKPSPRAFKGGDPTPEIHAVSLAS